MANEIIQSLTNNLDASLTAVKDALPKDFNQERFLQNTIAVVRSNPDLLQFKSSELLVNCMRAAYLGLDFMNKEAYIIPYGNTLQFQTDYKGEVKFTKKYATKPIDDIYAKVVREGDEYVEKITDGHPSIDFKPLPFNGGDIKGAFAVVLYTDGTMAYEAMSVADIQSVRNNYSKASQSKAWKYSFDEMCKKTVLRRLCKHIDIDFENVERKNAWEKGSGMDFDNTVSTKNTPGEVVDVFKQPDEIEVESAVVESEENNGTDC